MFARLHDELDKFPTHRVMAVVALIVGAWRLYVAPSFDTTLLVYLWWLSEVTAHESWLARRLEEGKTSQGVDDSGAEE